MNGTTLPEIAEVLGHKTLAMVERYSHLAEQQTAEVVARMNERFLAWLAASPRGSEVEVRIMREVLR